MNRKEENKGKTSKPQYGMGGNVLYMLRLGREVPGLLPQRFCLVLVSVVISVTGLYMSPALLRILEEGQLLERQSHLLISARQIILDRMNSKVGTCSYPLLQNDDFLNKWEKGRRATSNNGAAAEAGRSGNRFFNFYGNLLYTEEKRALDMRMYRQDIYGQEVDSANNSWTGDGVFVKLNRGTLGIISGITKLLSQMMMGFGYLYVCLKAWYGAFGVGSVTQYVGRCRPWRSVFPS